MQNTTDNNNCPDDSAWTPGMIISFIGNAMQALALIALSFKYLHLKTSSSDMHELEIDRTAKTNPD